MNKTAETAQIAALLDDTGIESDEFLDTLSGACIYTCAFTRHACVCTNPCCVTKYQVDGGGEGDDSESY
jgi:hypothetical protein